MRVRARLAFLSLLAALAQPAVAAAQEGILLRYRLQPGQTFRTVTTTRTETSQTMQGTEVTTTQTMVQEGLMEVLSVDEAGAARIRSSTESVRVTMETPMETLTFDSADPDAPVPPALQAFAGLHGTAFVLTLAPDGDVRDVEGGEELVERMAERMSALPGRSPEALKADLQAQFGDEAMSEMLAQGFGRYPAEPLPLGASWTRTARVAGVPLVVETTSTLTGRAGAIVTLETRSTFTGDSATGVTPGEVTQRYDVTGTGTGTLEIEEATGLPLRTRSEMTMTGTLRFAAGGREMAFPMSSRSVMTSERRPAH